MSAVAAEGVIAAAAFLRSETAVDVTVSIVVVGADVVAALIVRIRGIAPLAIAIPVIGSARVFSTEMALLIIIAFSRHYLLLGYTDERAGNFNVDLVLGEYVELVLGLRGRPIFGRRGDGKPYKQLRYSVV